MCNTNCPEFLFDHSVASTIYYSPDIDPGHSMPIPANANLTSSVKVYNNGLKAVARISLWAAPPGTSVNFAASVLLHEGDTANPVDACAGAVLGKSAFADFAVPWTPNLVPGFVPNSGNTLHTCLFAKVKVNGVAGCNTPYPSDDLPTTAQNAQHNIDIMDVQLKALRRHRRKAHFAFGVVNPVDEHLDGAIAVRLLGKEQRVLNRLFKSALFKGLRQDRLRDGNANLTLGRERIVVPRESPAALRRRFALPLEKQSFLRLGHVGEVDLDTFQELTTSCAAPRQEVSLVRGEIQQAFVEFDVPEDAKPGDLFAAEIIHAAKREEGMTAVGGLLVILRVLDDDKPERSKGKAAAR